MSSVDRGTDETLMTALRGAFESVDLVPSLTSLRRRDNDYASTHPTEVLECATSGTSLPPILCKTGPSELRDHLGLRHGVGYEAYVYRRVLLDRVATPRFYGSYSAESGMTWLFLEYLGEGWQLDLGPYTAIADAASMMGDLHRRRTETTETEAMSALNRYDGRHCRTCLRQAMTFAEEWRQRVRAFDRLADRFAEQIRLLVSAPPTIIHGEFTPDNVVWANDRPYLVDWERAGYGAGELDLAMLTEDWDEELVELATAAYVCTRWPTGSPPHDFAATLDAARLYWLFRWLGDPNEAGTEEEIAWIVGRAEHIAQSARAR